MENEARNSNQAFFESGVKFPNLSAWERLSPKQKKDLRTIDNRNHAHGVTYKGVYYENGMPNPRRSFKIGGVSSLNFQRGSR